MIRRIWSAIDRRLRRLTGTHLATWRLRAMGATVGKNLTTYGPFRVMLTEGARLVIGDNVTLCRDVFLRVSGKGYLIIGDGGTIHDYSCLMAGGNLTLGKNVWVGNGGHLYADGDVTIGDDVLMAPYVQLQDADHRIDRLDVPIRWQGNTPPEPIHIGGGVWLGAKVTVTKGVTIGEGAVIGANAVVTRDIPSMAIAVGIPARVIKYRTEVADSIVKSLIE